MTDLRMDLDQSCTDGAQEPASFKGQMAARYKERQSMGFHLAQFTTHDNGSSSTGSADETATTTNQPVDSNLIHSHEDKEGEKLTTRQFVSLPKRSMSVDEEGTPMEHGKGGVTVNSRRSMRDLISQFEKRSNTLLYPTQLKERDQTFDQKRASGEYAGKLTADALVYDEGLEGAAAFEEKVVPVVSETYKGSDRAMRISVNNGLDSLSVSLSDDSLELNVDALREPNEYVLGPERDDYFIEMCKFDNTNLKVDNCILDIRDRGEVEHDKEKYYHSEVGLGDMDRNKEIKVDGTEKSKELGEEHKNIMAQENQDSHTLGHKNNKETEYGFPEPKLKELKPPEAEETENVPKQEAAVPEPLRVNLKDFAARKKRSSNTGDMKYVVHRKDWKKVAPNHLESGSRQKQSDILPKGLTPKSKSQQHTQKGTLSMPFLRKHILRESRSEKTGFTKAHRSIGKRNNFTSASNTQQRLERRQSQRSLVASPTPDAFTARVDGGLRRHGSAMERYFTFLNKANKYGQHRKTKQRQHHFQESESSQQCLSVPEQKPFHFSQPNPKQGGQQTQSPVAPPEFSLLAKPLPPKRNDKYHQSLQELLKQVQDMEKRQRPTEKRENRKLYSALLQKAESLGLMSPSTGSFVSNANVTSTIEIEKHTDRAVAHQQIMTPSHDDSNTFAQHTEPEYRSTGVCHHPLSKINTTQEKGKQSIHGDISKLNQAKTEDNEVPISPTTVPQVTSEAGQENGCNLSLGSLSDRRQKFARTNRQSLNPIASTGELCHQPCCNISPWIRASHESNLLSANQGIPSATSVGREVMSANNTLANAGKRKFSLIGQRLFAQTIPSFDSLKRNARLDSTIFDSQSSMGLLRPQMYRQKSLLSAEQKTTPTITRQNVSKQSPQSSSIVHSAFEDRKDVTPTRQPLSGCLECSSNMAHDVPFSTHVCQVFDSVSLNRIAYDTPEQRATTLANSTSPASNTKFCEKPANPLKVNKTQKSSPKHLRSKADNYVGATSTSAAKAFSQTSKRHAVESKLKNVHTDSQEACSKRISKFYSGSKNKTAGKSMSAHTGNWHRPANPRNESPQRQHAQYYDDARSTAASSEDNNLREHASSETMVDRRSVELNPKLKQVSPYSMLLSQTSSISKVGLSPDTPRVLKISPRIMPNLQDSLEKPSGYMCSQNHKRCYQQQPRLRLKTGNITVPEIAPGTAPSETFLSSKVKKAEMNSQVACEGKKWPKLRTPSTEAAKVSMPTQVKRKTFGSASRIDQTRRRTAVTPSVVSRTPGIGIEDGVSAGGESTAKETQPQKEKPMTTLLSDTKNLEQSPIQTRNTKSPPKIIRKLCSPDNAGLGDALTPQRPASRDAGRESVQSACEEKEMAKEEVSSCHFGNSIPNSEITRTSDVDDTKRDHSVTETSPRKRKRKFMDKAKKTKRKKRKKQEESTLMLQAKEKSPGAKSLPDKPNETESPEKSQQKLLEPEGGVVDEVIRTEEVLSEVSHSQQGSISRKESLETNHTVGVTSVTIKKRSLSRSPPRLSRHTKQATYRPVRPLCCKPTALFPSFSHIPLRIAHHASFLSMRKRPELLAQYRRWREGIVDPDRPSKIPLSMGFRWTLDSAVIEEWALHCWEPDSGIYMDEQGTWWSSVSESPPHISLHSSLFADSHPLSMDGLLELSTRLPNLKLGPLRLLHASYMAVGAVCLAMSHLFARLYQCGGDDLDFYCQEDDIECLMQLAG